MNDCTVILFDNLQNQWTEFSNPATIISDINHDAIPRLLHEIERIVESKDLFAAGFISYEAGNFFSAHCNYTDDDFPLIWFGLFREMRKIPPPLYHPDNIYPPITPNWVASVSKAEYNTGIDKIKKYIASGDTYQVNYSYRLNAPFPWNPWHYFLRIARAQKSKYCAYIETEQFAICSASPELFFHLDGKNITSKPMKGTVPRGKTLQEDRQQRHWLYNSEKNRAENIMIVDMVRNDLGQIADIGSVTVPVLFETEKYPTVWQMTSTVTAKTDAGLSEIITALFPPASITGAPKKRTMEIISEIEPSPRRIYTGAIGYIAPKRKMQFNVAIRTVLINKSTNTAEYGVGGGIVWDSTVNEEFDETRNKAEILTCTLPECDLLETILWENPRGLFLLDYHLTRLSESADYFDYTLDVCQLHNSLTQLTESFTEERYKIRILLNKTGSISITAQPLPDNPAKPLRIALAENPVDSSSPFLYHKTTNRELYNNALENAPDYDNIILWNEKEEITELCTANIMIKQKGKWITPPLICGLLAGIYRQYLIDNKQLAEQKIYYSDLKTAEEICLINSVRKSQRCILCSR